MWTEGERKFFSCFGCGGLTCLGERGEKRGRMGSRWVILVVLLSGFGWTTSLIVNPNVVGYVRMWEVGDRWDYEVERFGGDVRLGEVAERVRGGTEVKSAGEYPFMATLQILEPMGTLIFVCSAHLLSSRLVITAARCLVGSQGRTITFVVCAGSLDAVHPGTCATVSTTTLHPDVKPGPDGVRIGDPDIAVLSLEEGLEGKDIGYVFVKNRLPNVNDGVHIMGFSPLEGGSLTDVSFKLRVADTTYIPNNENCAALKELGEKNGIGNELVEKDSYFCASSESRTDHALKVAACQFDFGSPMIFGKNGALGSFSVQGPAACSPSNTESNDSIYVRYGSETVRKFLYPFVQEASRELSKSDRSTHPKRVSGCAPKDRNVWFTSKARGIPAQGFTSLPAMMTKFSSSGWRFISTEYSVGRNLSSVIVTDFESEGSQGKLVVVLHGIRQDQAGKDMHLKRTSFVVKNLPKGARTFLMYGSYRLRYDTSRVEFISMTASFRDPLVTGFAILLPAEPLNTCLDFIVSQSDSESDRPLCLRTQSDEFLTRSCYPTYEGFYFNICPWASCP